MSDYAVLGDLLVIYTVSTVVVFVFHQFRLPSIAGFFVAGALIGPHGLHLIPDVSQVQVLAEIGIVLLALHHRHGVFVRAFCGGPPHSDGRGSRSRPEAC